MKNQLQKLTQKLAEKISSKKYEQMIDPTVPTIKKSNANFCKKLFYNKLDQNKEQFFDEFYQCNKWEIVLQQPGFEMS